MPVRATKGKALITISQRKIQRCTRDSTAGKAAFRSSCPHNREKKKHY